MTKSTTILKYVLVAVLVLAVGGLAGWYFFLRSAQQSISTADTARGYGVAAPTFEGSTGSTYQNAAATLNVSGNASYSAGTSSARLWQVSAVPVAGFGWSNSASPTLRFAEQSSGYLFVADLSARSVSRLTDTLRPKTYEALFTLDGSVIERSLDDTGTILTFAATLATSTNAAQNSSTSTPDSLVGSLLAQNIPALAADPVSDTLVYTMNSASGVSIVSTNWAGAKEKHLSSLPLSDWRIFTPGDGSIVVSQKAADDVQGYAYTLQKDGSLSPIAQGPGLTVLPHAASAALIFGESAGGALSLFGQTSASATPVPLSLHTTADKCAWMPGTNSLIAYCGVPQSISSQQFLDDWYKGMTHTSDQWWEVNLGVGTTTLIDSPPADANVALDVVNPSIDPSGRYIAFENAADGSLWVLRISQ